MSSNAELPPGTGAFRPGEPPERVAPGSFEPGNHMSGWNIAIQNALDNIGRSPGQYSTKLTLSATVDVHNPGYVVEYIAKFI
jgi:hypothetical protein